jgi:hypothetical protein
VSVSGYIGHGRRRQHVEARRHDERGGATDDQPGGGGKSPQAGLRRHQPLGALLRDESSGGGAGCGGWLRGTILQTLTGNGLSGPVNAAFDGERVLVTNYNSANNTVSLWKATDLTPLGSFSLYAAANNLPIGACSDGQNFWVTLSGPQSGLARF